MSHWCYPSDTHSVRGTLAATLDAVGFQTPQSADFRATFGLPEAPKACFVLVDGLGMANLEARSGHARVLRSWRRCGELTTVAPSTTAAAITAVGTGALPGQTAMTSYALRSPVTGENFSLIKWQGSGLDPLAWQTHPTLFEQLGAEQADQCVLIQPSEFIASGLTLCALRGARAVSANSREDRVDAAVRSLRQGARAAYVYWGELDHVGHGAGWQSEEWVSELESLDSAMAQLARRLEKGTLIVLTADHGMVDVTHRIDVAETAALREGVSLVSGEERSVHLYSDDPEAVASRWKDFFGDDEALVLTKEQIGESGLFGPLVDTARDTMGDVVAFMGGTASVIDSRLRHPGQSFMVGVHGSLTAEEMSIPLLAEVA